MQIFEHMFGTNFWSQAVIIFTRLKMDTYNVAERQRINGQSDKELADNYLASLRRKFAKANDLKYVFLDVCGSSENEDDADVFEEGLKNVWGFVEVAPMLSTENVKKVETEYLKLKNEVERKEQQMKEIKSQRSVDNERL